MIERARRLAEIFKKYNIEYLFIGKFGATLYGYPGTTQDMDIFPSKERSNCEKLVVALKELGFDLNEELEGAILSAKDFIQIRGGPFPIDIVFAPDGIKSFDDARKRSQLLDEVFFCASLEDIIESKKAAGRQRDKEELPQPSSIAFPRPYYRKVDNEMVILTTKARYGKDFPGERVGK